MPLDATFSSNAYRHPTDIVEAAVLDCPPRFT
jgi:hypothetical protein